MLYFSCIEYVHIMKYIYWYMYYCKTNKVNVREDVAKLRRMCALLMKNNPDFSVIFDFCYFEKKK